MLKMRVLCGGGPKVLVAQAALLLVVAAGCVSAWGGRFNRFNPTALNSYGGYGGAGSSGNNYYSNYGKEKFGVEEKVLGQFYYCTIDFLNGNARISVLQSCDKTPLASG